MVLRLDVLGPPRLVVDEQPHKLRPRALDVLSALAVRPTAAATTDVLAELIWTEVPVSAHAVIQNQVAYVRTEIGPDAITTERAGYQLGTEIRRDVDRFEQMVGNADRARRLGDVRTAHDEAAVALELVRGAPFQRLPATIPVVRARQHTTALMLAAEETLASALIALGEHERAAALAERMVADSPQREYRWALAAVALYRGQRRREALASMTAAVRTLADAGLEPGPALKRLESLLHADDPRLFDPDVLDDLVPQSGGRSSTSAARRSPRSVRTTVLDIVEREHAAGRSALVAVTADRPFATTTLAEGVASTAERFGWHGELVECRRSNGDPRHPVNLIHALDRFDPVSGAPRAVIIDHAEARGPDADLAIASIVRDNGPSIVMIGAAHPEATHVRLEDAHDHLDTTNPTDDERAPDVALRFALRIALGRGGVPLDVADQLPGRRHLALLADRALIDVSTERLEAWSDDIGDQLVADASTADLAAAHDDLADAYRNTGVAPAEEAHHRLAAAALDGGDTQAALDALTRAADHFAERGELYRAAALLMRSAVLADDPGEGVTRSIRAGDYLRRAGDVRSEDVLRAAARTAISDGRVDLAADALTGLGALGATSEAGSVDPTLARDIDDVLDSDLDQERAARLAGAATLLHSIAGDHQRTVAYYRRAHGEADGATDATRGRVLPYAYMAVTGPDSIGERQQIARELFALAERLDDDDVRFEALHLTFSNQLQLGDPAIYSTHVAMAAMAERGRDRQRAWVASYIGSTLEHLAGRVDKAEASAESCLSAPGVAASRTIAIYSVQLMAIRLTQGRLAELAEPLDQLVTDQPGVPGWRAGAALAAAEVGDHERAHAQLEQLASIGGLPTDATWSATGFVAGCAAALSGDSAAAEWLLPALAPMAGLMSWPGSCTLGPCDAAIGALHAVRGDDEQAMQHRRSARAILEDLASPVFNSLLDRLDQVSLG
ncbi:MAG: BTAD domain-containing putative transcriptional regulator [Actinomycetota bacterium]